MNYKNDNYYAPSAPPKSLYDELLEAGDSQQNLNPLQRIRENISGYKSNTVKFIEELSNVSRRMSLTSQTSNMEEKEQPGTSTMEDPNSLLSNPVWQCDDYTLVSRKKKRSPESNPRNVRQKGDSLPIETEIQNRFSPLLSENPQEQEIFEEVPRKPQIQPIFVTNITNFKAFQNDVNQMGFKEKYLVKVLSNQIKILPDDIPTYREMISYFKSKNVSYYTHRLKQERSFRVVLKNVHHTTPHEDIIEDLAALGYVVENVSNIKHARTKEPLSMFFIDLKNDPHNKDIYSVTKMGNKIVSFEPPNKRREIPQCKRCQRFGHTQNNCGRSFRCVKCPDNHSTIACPKKNRETPAICTNCGEHHPANYKGCQVYRQLLEKKFPPLRKRQTTNLHSTSRPVTPNYIRQNFSYANCVKQTQNRNINNNEVPEAPNSINPDENNLVAFMKQSFLELKDMFRDLMQQNSVMVNLLTALVSKIK